MNTIPPPFDAVAQDYDAAFTHTPVGRLLRERVWALLPSCLLPPATASATTNALELNCGTGEDAIRLARQGFRVLATDISPAMVEAAKSKVQVAGLEDRIDVQVCGLEELNRLSGQQYDFIFSNFGGLNCLSPAALARLGGQAEQLLVPGGRFAAVVMSRFCWWEALYFLLKMKPREAFRRIGKKPVNARLDEKTVVPTWYYAPEEFRRLFAPRLRNPGGFVNVGVHPVGFWLPPSYLNPFFEKHSRFLRLLAFLEKQGAPAWTAPAADHFLICMKKTL